MKQKNISGWLKGLVVLLGVMGLFFFGAVTVLAFWMKDQQAGSLLWSFVFFSWYTALLCYGVLFQFWNVCTQIGRDNSFSLENAAAFHRMALFGGAAAIGYPVRLIYLCIAAGIRWQVVCYRLCMTLLCIACTILC